MTPSGTSDFTFWTSYFAVVLGVFAAVLVPDHWMGRILTVLIRLPDFFGWARCVAFHQIVVTPNETDERWALTTCSCGRSWLWRVKWG